jgi:hypothetical protein
VDCSPENTDLINFIPCGSSAMTTVHDISQVLSKCFGDKGMNERCSGKDKEETVTARFL